MCLAEVVGRGLRPLAAASEEASRKLSCIPSERCPLYTTALIMASLQTFPSETVSSAHYVCALRCLFSLYFGFFVQHCQQSVLCSFLSFTASADFLPTTVWILPPQYGFSTSTLTEFQVSTSCVHTCHRVCSWVTCHYARVSASLAPPLLPGPPQRPLVFIFL